MVHQRKEVFLLIGVESGFVSCVVIRGERIFFHSRAFEKKQPSPINKIAVVDWKGQPLFVEASSWKELSTKKQKAEKESGSAQQQEAPKQQPEKKDEEVKGTEHEEKEKKEEKEEGTNNQEKVAEEVDESSHGTTLAQGAEENLDALGMRFLLLCAEASICIYTLPQFDQLVRIESKYPVLSSHIVSYKGNIVRIYMSDAFLLINRKVNY